MEMMDKMMRLGAAMALAGTISAHRAGAQGDPHPDSTAKGLAAWRYSRLGLFIHWGPVSLKGTEIGWSRGTQVPRAEYDGLYKGFNPTGFDAREWVDVAKAGGFRYLTLTTKHHDGFCLWDSKFTDYDIMASPFGRDATGELTRECKRQGVRFDAYYSVLDWYQPDWQPAGPGGPGYALPAGQAPSMDRYVAYLKSQVGELIAKYDPGAIWFDGDWDATWSQGGHAYGKDVYRTLKLLKPSLVIDNRVYGDRGGWARDFPAAPGDYDTPEKQIGAFDLRRPWETCNTLADQWAYRPGNVMRPVSDYIREIVQTLGGDGNYMLNIGPGPDGRMAANEAAMLRSIGAWTTVHAEGLYGTRGGPWVPGAWGGATWRGDTIYVHVLKWDGSDRCVLPDIPLQVLSTSRLGGGQVGVSRAGGNLIVTVPKAGRDPVAETIRMVMNGSWLSPGLAYTQSSVLDPFNASRAELLSGDAKDFAFHTDQEESPSLVIDLGADARVMGLQIANRADTAFRARARTLTAWVSGDGKAWTEAWRATEAAEVWNAVLGGAEGKGIAGRYLKLGLRENGWLHLRNVKVFGSMSETPASSLSRNRVKPGHPQGLLRSPGGGALGVLEEQVFTGVNGRAVPTP